MSAEKLRYERTWTCEVSGRETWLGILARGSNDDHEYEPPPAVYVAAYHLSDMDFPVFCGFGDSAASAVARLIQDKGIPVKRGEW